MRTTRPTISFIQQLLHGLLFAAAVFCAICLRGNPILMYGVLIAILPAILLSSIPFKYFPPLFRQLLQLLLGALSLIWAHQQLGVAPIDIILIEIASILGISLMLGRSQHEYSLLFFISFGFLGYGGLMPGRPYFLQIFVAALALSLIILYNGRIAVITDRFNTTRKSGDRKTALGNSLGYRFLHAAFTIAVVFIMLKHLPQTKALKTKGLVPVSFNTEQDILFPSLWKQWNLPATALIGGSNENSGDEQDGFSSFKQHDAGANNLNKTDESPTFDSHAGSGMAFGVGTKLVFRAVTPAKLYWVVQMYDDYDGDTWKGSKAMRTGKTGPDEFIPIREVEVPQHISMDNPQSYKMPYAFRFKQATLRNSQSVGNAFLRPGLKDKFTLELKGRNIGKPPWRYRVQSFVPNPEQKKTLRAWREPQRNNGWNYRRLPTDIISDRLRELAAEITRDAQNPFEKAVMIRDYLRNNYTYDLNAPQIPRNREVVDYFLFESKTGYCQHFAQAFTVLARLAGLHARLVTGYSPGNYNLLTNTFEVYQYHAHAWTHIFVEPYGWLTFDGVAPGNLRLENTPALLTDVMDPFGEDWQSRPPELTYIPPPSENQSMKQNPNQTSNSFAGKVYQKAANDNRTAEPNAAELGKAAVELACQTFTEKLEALKQKIIQALIKAWDTFKEQTQAAIMAVLNMTPLHMLAMAFSLLVIGAAYAKRNLLYRLMRNLRYIYRCRKLWFSLEKNGLTPNRRILICQDVASGLLKLAGFKRPPAVDLMEWADLIAQKSPDSAAYYRQVAVAASRVQFSNEKATPELASDITILTARLCKLLSPNISAALAQAANASA